MVSYQPRGLTQVAALREVWCLDVGTAETRVRYSSQVFHQPTQCLYSPTQKEVIALSNRLTSSSSQKKNPEALMSEPIVKARFSDFDQAVGYLRAIRQHLKPQEWWREWVPSTQLAKVAIPSQAFPSDRQILERIYRLAGWSEVTLITKSQAHWQHFRTELAESTIGLAIDIGADTTEIVVFDQQHVLGAVTWYQGSNDLTKLIQQHAQRRLGAQVTWSQADRVKTQLTGIWPASLAGRLQSRHLVIKGRELDTGVATNVTFPASLLNEVYGDWYRDLVSKVQSLFGQTAVTRSLKVNELRIWLAGGGGQLPGLTEALEIDLGTFVTVAADPEQVVLKGLVVS